MSVGKVEILISSLVVLQSCLDNETRSNIRVFSVLGFCHDSSRGD